MYPGDHDGQEEQHALGPGRRHSDPCTLPPLLYTQPRRVRRSHGATCSMADPEPFSLGVNISFLHTILAFIQTTFNLLNLSPCFYKLFNHIPTSSRSPTNFDKLIWYALFRRIASGIHSYLQLVLAAGAVFHTHLTRFHNNIHIELESSLASAVIQ